MGPGPGRRRRRGGSGTPARYAHSLTRRRRHPSLFKPRESSSSVRTPYPRTEVNKFNSSNPIHLHPKLTCRSVRADHPAERHAPQIPEAVVPGLLRLPRRRGVGALRPARVLRAAVQTRGVRLENQTSRAGGGAGHGASRAHGRVQRDTLLHRG